MNCCRKLLFVGYFIFNDFFAPEERDSAAANSVGVNSTSKSVSGNVNGNGNASGTNSNSLNSNQQAKEK